MKRSRIMLPILAAIVGIVASAFTVDFRENRATTYFKYLSTDPNGYTNASNWQTFPSMPNGCSDGTKTCIVSSDVFTTTTALANYLQTQDPDQDPQTSDGDTYNIRNKSATLQEQE